MNLFLDKFNGVLSDFLPRIHNSMDSIICNRVCIVVGLDEVKNDKSLHKFMKAFLIGGNYKLCKNIITNLLLLKSRE